MNLEEDLDSLVANTPMKKDEYRISSISIKIKADIKSQVTKT
jgi:hypothetical protein